MALPVQNINHSAFRSMFEKEKLSGNNFNEWFARLKLVLRVEKKMHVIEQPIHPSCLLAVVFDCTIRLTMIQELTILFENKLGGEDYLEKLERLGYVLPQDISVGLILNGLTKDFVGFVRNYNMHNMGKTIGEIHAMLIEYEKGLPKKAETPQVKGKGKDKKDYIPKPKNPKPTAMERPAKDDACHHCKEVGHWKRNCPVYLAELQKKRKQVGSASSSGSKDKLKQELFNYNLSYAPTITRGVVLVSRLVDNGFVQCFTDYGISVSKNGVLYFNAVSRNESATRILNMVPTKKVDKTPYELWYGKVPNLSYLKVWGCEALVKRDTPDKLEQRSVKCIFIGYPKETMDHYFYFLPENKIIVAMYAEFFEKRLISQEISGRVVEGFEPPQEEVIPIRRSERTHRAPNRLCLNIEVEEHSLGDLNEPTSYKAAMLDSESNKWIDAMNAEIQSMMDNMVLFDPNQSKESIASFKDPIYGLEQASIEAGIKELTRNQNVGLGLNKSQGAQTPKEVNRMKNVPYASAVGSIMYAVSYTRPDVAFAQNLTSQFQQNPGELHWTAMKNILKYLRNTKDMFLVYGGNPSIKLRVECYCDAGFETDRDDTKSQAGYVFVLNGGAVDWKSFKQSTTAMSATEFEYIAASEAAMEAVWIRKFISGLY
ncbi:retrotransposon protein, putative, ty1-copia subclass [Tanacetum coccineum]